MPGGPGAAASGGRTLPFISRWALSTSTRRGAGDTAENQTDGVSAFRPPQPGGRGADPHGRATRCMETRARGVVGRSPHPALSRCDSWEKDMLHRVFLPGNWVKAGEDRRGPSLLQLDGQNI